MENTTNSQPTGTQSTRKGRKSKRSQNASEIKLEAITALTTLPENGNFFLFIASEEADNKILVNWH